jgi:hypothetical protein
LYPLWNIAVFFAYALRRVNCPRCGVKVERVPWAEGKNTLTRTYMQFLATWAKRLSWKETAVVFRTSWEKVFRSVGSELGELPVKSATMSLTSLSPNLLMFNLNCFIHGHQDTKTEKLIKVNFLFIIY